jgi:hypothetical protein
MNKSEREKSVKILLGEGYNVSADGSRLVKGSKFGVFSSSGNSINVNGTVYNTAAGVRTSTKK